MSDNKQGEDIQQISYETGMSLVEVGKALFDQEAQLSRLVLPEVRGTDLAAVLQSQSKFKTENYGRIELLEEYSEQGIKIYRWKLPDLMHYCLLKISDHEGGCSLEINLRVFHYKMRARIVAMLAFLVFGIAFFYTGGFQFHNILFLLILAYSLYQSQFQGANMLQQFVKSRLLEMLDSPDLLSTRDP